MIKNHHNQNNYITKTYLLKQFSTNMRTKIKFCLVFGTWLAFVNKKQRMLL